MSNPHTVLVVHNHYQQRGGEDSVFETECAMLEAAGHVVIRYEKHNDEIGDQRLAASGQRLEAPTAQVLGTRYQVLANTQFPKKDNPQALAPSPYHLAPSSTPTHPHTHTLPPQPSSQSCQSCNPVKKTFRVFSCFSWLKKLSLFSKTIWNSRTYREITALIKRHHPDIVHCHNTFPLISPSVYWAAARQGVPVVQTLHNYRLVCINPYLYRNGRICEDCLGHSPLPGVIHRCYRNSFSASFTVATMLVIHRLLGTYRNKVTTYIALTEFGRRKFLEARLCDPAKVVVKPNAVSAMAVPAEVLGTRYQVLANTQSTSKDSPEALAPSRYSLAAEHGRGGTTTVLYVGRLSPEKGVDILIAAWKLFLAQQDDKRLAASPSARCATADKSGQRLDRQENRNDSSATLVPSTYHLVPKAQPRLHIIGDGPERAALEAAARGIPSIEFSGRIPHDQIASHMRSATVLVLPTRCYEMFAITPLEAMQIGLPVILSESAAAGSIITNRESGLVFENENPQSLATVLGESLFTDTKLLEQIRQRAMQSLEKSCCDRMKNIEQLTTIYAHLIATQTNQGDWHD